MSAGCIGGVQTTSARISRLAGPCTATLWSSSVDCFTHARSDSASASSRRWTPVYSSPVTKRKLSSRQPVDGGVVEHPAGLVADRRVGHLADRQLAGVARDRSLHQELGVGADDLPLSKRREVHDRGPLPAGPVLGDRALALEAVRQPVAAVLDEVAGQLRRARVKGGFFGHDGVGLRGDAVGDGQREPVLGPVDADVDVRDLPAVGRIDVVGAGRRGAHAGRSRRAAARSRRAVTTARRPSTGCRRRRPCCRRS